MVYYVEDDRNIREFTVYALNQAGIEAVGCSDDLEFRRACADQPPDAILLDIMLPGTDGIEILKRLRSAKATEDIPVMMLTAKDSELDTVRALDAGADDYLAKPFGMMEMVSRTRALLRRARKPSARPESVPISMGGLTIWPDRREVAVCGVNVQLTMREFDLLVYLARSSGVVLTREELLRRVWGWDFDGGSRTVDVHIQQLRSKLGDPELIETVRGVGYRMKG